MYVIENCYKLISSPENIWLAWKEYRKGKRTCPVVREFEYELEENLLELIEDLHGETFQHGGYSKFVVRDPKQRTISAPLVRDHIVHQAIYNVLYPFFEKVFLPFSFSCRKNKGTYKAVELISKYLRQVSRNHRKECWVLHGDIKKCFDSINHKVLLELLNERIKCNKTIKLLNKIIASYDVRSSGSDNERHGIPLGNLTSQLFINIYLHKLDFFVKEKLRVKRYVRYADDFILMFPTQAECQEKATVIREFLKRELKLEFPPSHEQVNKITQGVEVLGIKFLPFYRKIKPDTYRRSEHLFKKRCIAYAENSVDVNHLNASWQSLMGLLRHGHNITKAKQLLNIVSEYA